MSEQVSRSDVYEAPGIETAVVVVPAVALVALISTIAVAVIDTLWHGVLVGFGGFLTGCAAWLALWELFVRLHPRFSHGAGNSVKWLAVVCGPPVIALVAVVLLAGRLGAG